MGTGVSSLSFSQATRFATTRAQAELTRAQKEVSTGRVADLGLALGSRAAHSVSLNRDWARLNNIVDTNALASARLGSTQDALTQLNAQAQSFLSTLTTASGTGGTSPVLARDAEATLAALGSVLNSSLNGEYLFAGINTDAKPLNDWSAPGAPAKAAFDAAFLAHFGFSQSDAAAQNISQADMESFLAAAEPQFLGAGWEANWSNATDGGIVSRIALNETAETSVSANDAGIRKLAMAAATISGLLGANVGPGGQEALVKRAISLVGEAVGGIADMQARAGIMEKRVAAATDRLTAQADLFETHIGKLEGIDPYEASTRVSMLLQQIETSYALTARIQQLSLVRFLG